MPYSPAFLAVVSLNPARGGGRKCHSADVFPQVWIEFGRIKLPQGYHPNDVEEEWGKLIIEMLEREKLLRPAVERWGLWPWRGVPRRGVPCSPGCGDVPDLILFSSVTAGLNCCYKSLTKSRMVL